MTRYHLYASLILISLPRCSDSEQNHVFQFPVFEQGDLTVEKCETKTYSSLEQFLAPFLDKFKIGDTLSTALSTNHTYVPTSDYYSHDHRRLDSDTIDVKGMLLTCNPYDTVLFKYPFLDSCHELHFPVYLVNQTGENKYLLGKDSHLRATLEALDRDSIWRPLQTNCVPQCGNGKWTLKIKNDEFAAFLVPVLSGDYTTTLRVKLPNRNTLYTSNSFEGSINEEQFMIKDEWISGLALSDFAPIYFNGSIPLCYDDIIPTWNVDSCFNRINR